jgi:O-antigen ligase
MLEVTDSKQVLYLIPLGLIAFTIFPKTGRLGRPAIAAGSLLVMLAIIVPVALAFPGTKAAVGYIQIGDHVKIGKPPVVAAMKHNFRAQPTSIPFGFGPGETVSRFAFLTTPLLLKSGSPISALGIPPGKYTAYYQTLATENIPPSVGISSFDQAQSSLLGIIGDYGLAGFIAFAGLIAAILRALWARGRSSPAAAAVFAGWIMIIPLAYIFDWLEEPAFTTYLAAATGLALVWTAHRATPRAESLPLLLLNERDAQYDGRITAPSG